MLLNFDILGEMEIKTGVEAQQLAKPVQNENIFDNKDAQTPVQNTDKTAAEYAQSKDAGIINGCKVVGISSLKPYQNL